MKVLTFNVQGLPRCFQDDHVRKVKDRVRKIRERLRAYDVVLLQEDVFRRYAGHHSPFLPVAGLTTRIPGKGRVRFERFRDQAFKRSNFMQWLTRKGFLTVELGQFLVLDTHFAAREESEAVAARKSQLAQVGLALPREGPAILGGDWNPESAQERDALRELLYSHGFSQVSIETRKGKDFIFARDLMVTASGEDSLLSRMSDHPALWVELA